MAVPATNKSTKVKRQYCDAPKRQGEGTCRNPAGWGTSHAGWGTCKLHGGSTDKGLKNAQEAMIRAAQEKYGVPREVDPHAALIEELHRTAGHVSWLALQVQTMDDDEMYDYVGGGPGAVPGTEPHIWLRLYREERNHFLRVAKTCLDAGIAERQVRVAEQQGVLLARAIQGILGELGVANRPETAGIVRKHLIELPMNTVRGEPADDPTAILAIADGTTNTSA